MVVALALGGLAAPAPAAPASRRALVIGINDYSGQSAGKKAARGKKAAGGRVWESLDGAVEDARAFRDLLVGRYGFKPDEVLFITDGQATRARILEAVDGWLLDGAEKGSLRIFYYAGHGSQVQNSRSPEEDKKDETLVPADAARGAADIRDKELAVRLDRAGRAGVELTVVLDSCHSGSATRGIQAGKARMLAPLDVDVADPEAAPDPTQSGVVVLAAAQDREVAREVKENGKPHGAFTLALIQALSSLPADEGLDQVFRKTKAIMQRDGRGQEPDLRGPDERKRRSLLGATPGAAPARPIVAVRNLRDAESIELQGGRAEELGPGCELVARGASGIRIRIIEVTGLSSSRAKLVSGAKEAIKPGDLFELDKWVAPERPNLTVWVPAPLAASEVTAAARALDELGRKRSDVVVAEDPTLLAPSHVVFWDGQEWALRGPEGVTALGKPLTAAALESGLAASKAPTLFLQVPPPPELVKALDLGAKTRNSAIAVDKTGDGAQYVLAGRMTAGRSEYAWVQLGLTAATLDKGSTLPFRGDWIDPTKPADAGAALTEQAVKLGRIRGWLFLENAREAFFPYRLALRDAAGKMHSDGIVKEGEVYQIVLRAEGRLPASVFPRYIYVFTIDQHGEAKLLYPPGGGGGGENRLPNLGESGAPSEFPLPTRFRVSAPFGVDSYVMLATDEPLADPTVLAFSGVKTRTRGGSPSPLERLLGNVGRRTRGSDPDGVPTNWSIDRVSFKSEARGSERP